MDENEHYELALCRTEKGLEAMLRLNIGGIHHVETMLPVYGDKFTLSVEADALEYRFYVITDDATVYLGKGFTKYLSSEVASGFTGVVMGLYAVAGEAAFREFSCIYG